MTVPASGCDTANVKPAPPLTLREPLAVRVTLTVALLAVDGAAPAPAPPATPVTTASVGGVDPTRSKGPLGDRLPVKLSTVEIVPDKTGVVTTAAGTGGGGTLMLTDTDSTTVALAVPTAVAALLSTAKATPPITRAQAAAC